MYHSRTGLKSFTSHPLLTYTSLTRNPKFPMLFVRHVNIYTSLKQSVKHRGSHSLADVCSEQCRSVNFYVRKGHRLRRPYEPPKIPSRRQRRIARPEGRRHACIMSLADSDEWPCATRSDKKTPSRLPVPITRHAGVKGHSNSSQLHNVMVRTMRDILHHIANHFVLLILQHQLDIIIHYSYTALFCPSYLPLYLFQLYLPYFCTLVIEWLLLEITAAGPIGLISSALQPGLSCSILLL